MARTQASARLHGFPREKRSPQSNLKEEVKKKNPILLVEAPLGIVGMPGTGRKTLAYRFGNMDRGIIQDGEVPVSYFYTAIFGGRFSPEQSDNPNERCRLRLTSYIIDPPAELPIHDPPLYWTHWNEFCCLVFVFDVLNQNSFLEVSTRLTGYRRENYRLPAVCLIVGNKCDRRYGILAHPDDPDYLNQRPVLEGTAFMEAEHLGAFYFECSAKNHIDVYPLLLFIKMLALERRYWIQDP